MQAWLCLVGGLLLSAYVLLWIRQRRARTLLAHLPSYPELPFIGNIHQLVGDGRNAFRLLDHISRIADEMMKPFVFWVGPMPQIVITDPDDVKTVTNAFIEKPYQYSFGKIWLGDALLTAPGFIWKQSIKTLGNTFNSAAVEGFQTIFNAQAHKLVENLKKEAGQEPWDVMHLLAYTTLETICQTAFGIPRISDSIVTREYYEAFNQALMLITRRGFYPWLYPDCVYHLTNDYKEMKRQICIVHSVSDTVLEKKKMERSKLKKTGSAKPDTGEEKKFQSVLDILLDMSERDPLLTEKQVRNEVNAIIVGGQETTATTMFYALLMIGARPAIQEKLYQELETIFEGTSRSVEKADLQKMPYCEAVILETLRLFPSVPAVLRCADRELQLKSCRVPKGTGCVINAWGAGRSKRAWGPDALEFDPARWLDGRASTNPAAFLPFSYGRRACIGKKYAMATMKTMLSYCVRELHFTSTTDKLEFKIDVALKTVSGHLMKVKLRK